MNEDQKRLLNKEDLLRLWAESLKQHPVEIVGQQLSNSILGSGAALSNNAMPIMLALRSTAPSL